jgi:glycosyltransferase involved in cell wall biosynthesis
MTLEHKGVIETAAGRGRKTADGSVAVSVVIPFFNEEESLGPLYEGLRGVLDHLGVSCEMVFVDDGSTDGSCAVITSLQNRDPRIRVVRLRRNFGQSAALAAGFDHARGTVMVPMDADLQNDPLDIPKLLDKIEEGYDVVSGWRVRRKDPLITRRVPSRLANILISKITGVKLKDYGCTLKAYRSEVIQNVKLYGEMHRLIPALASWMGIRMTEIPVNHFPRRFGRSKYGLKRIMTVLLDVFTTKFLLTYATRPMQIFGVMGGASFLAGTGFGVYLSILKIFYSQRIGDRPLLLLSVLLILFGTVLIMMGLLGELVVRTYHETQKKPIYMVKEVLVSESDAVSQVKVP